MGERGASRSAVGEGFSFERRVFSILSFFLYGRLLVKMPLIEQCYNERVITKCVHTSKKCEKLEWKICTGDIFGQLLPSTGFCSLARVLDHQGPFLRRRQEKELAGRQAHSGSQHRTLRRAR